MEPFIVGVKLDPLTSGRADRLRVNIGFSVFGAFGVAKVRFKTVTLHLGANQNHSATSRWETHANWLFHNDFLYVQENGFVINPSPTVVSNYCRCSNSKNALFYRAHHIFHINTFDV